MYNCVEDAKVVISSCIALYYWNNVFNISSITITTTTAVTNTLNAHLLVYKIILSIAQNSNINLQWAKNILLTTEKLVTPADYNIKELYFLSPTGQMNTQKYNS
jgi:hypothetical protein